MGLIKNFSSSDQYTKYSVIIIILFSIIVLSLTSVYHVSGDGCWHMSVSRFISEQKKIPLFEPLGRDEPFWSPPLYHFVAAFVYYAFSVFGHNAANFAVKLISPIFGILSLIVSFLLVKKLYSPKIAFYSAIFLAFIPIFIDYSVLSYVESMLVFFVVLSVYFLVNGKIVLSGIAAGLSVLAKYNGLFILPVLVYILYRKFGKDGKLFYKNSLIVISLSLIIASPWLIRNWILLGNPVWPFLNFIFNGYELKSFSSLDLSRFVDKSLILSAYFGIFGVPDGNYAILSAIGIEHLKILLPIWIFGTFIFLIPLFIGFFRKSVKEKRLFSLWILAYFALFLMYVANASPSVSRIMLPMFTALAVFWAYGLDGLLSNIRLKGIFIILIILVSAGFVFTSAAKTYMAANYWDFYKGDFEWARENTGSNEVFIANGQCIPYNLERTSLYFNEENLKKSDYVWINQNFWLDRRSILDDNSLKAIQSKKYKLVYSDKETGTEIYSAKQ
ncbi:glycosyltransferase family 39 protein [Candidatus Woesearchaeota archaeon]|nr:glycosyltransferase family 39 protein [Candidatus Woesearchaeota archaeon]